MTTQEIITLLTKNHAAFIAKITDLSDEDFSKSVPGKWTAGQQLEHIIKSVQVVAEAFQLPKPVLKEKFGTTNRKNRTYEKVVSDYLIVLKENPNYVLPEKFAPDKIAVQDKEAKLSALQKCIQKLVDLVNNYDNKDLERQILPHPVMGKLTLKEILCFTAYHVEHHNKQILKNLIT